MRELLITLLLLLSNAALSQELRIKGHVIGESLSDFLASEPKLSKQFAKCHAHPRNTSGECSWVAELQTRNWTTVSGAVPGPIWILDNNALGGMALYSCSDYIAILSDISDRLTANPVEDTVEMQNGFGATWTERRAAWTTPRYSAVLEEHRNPAWQLCPMFMRIETAAHHAASLAREKNKPSPLD